MGVFRGQRHHLNAEAKFCRGKFKDFAEEINITRELKRWTAPSGKCEWSTQVTQIHVTFTLRTTNSELNSRCGCNYAKHFFKPGDGKDNYIEQQSDELVRLI